MDTNTFSLYAAIKTPGNVYLKGRSGFEAERKTGNGLTYGIGFGFKAGNFRVEVEHTIFPEVDDPLYLFASSAKSMGHYPNRI